MVGEALLHGWRLLFAERHPYAGGEQHYAAYLEDRDGYEVELVAAAAAHGTGLAEERTARLARGTHRADAAEGRYGTEPPKARTCGDRGPGVRLDQLTEVGDLGGTDRARPGRAASPALPAGRSLQRPRSGHGHRGVQAEVTRGPADGDGTRLTANPAGRLLVVRAKTRPAR